MVKPNDAKANDAKANDIPTGIIPAEVSECSLTADSPNGVCVSKASLKLLSQITNTPQTKPDTEILHNAKKKLNCDTTRCVLGKLGDIGERDIVHKLKIPGPTDVSLLNNFNIDDTLKQWTSAFQTFFPYDFNMRDFTDNNKTLHTITMADLYAGNIQKHSIRKRLLLHPNEQKRPFNIAACVINTDFYNGKGKHWMALLVDMRNQYGPWTVEFFNSSGNAPAIEYAEWMEKTKIELEGVVAANALPDIQILNKRVCMAHQQSKTECGVYSLFYIYCRLKGTPVEYFQHNRIPDEVMFEFRQHLFHDNKREKVDVFDYEKFAKSTNILWE